MLSNSPTRNSPNITSSKASPASTGKEHQVSSVCIEFWLNECSEYFTKQLDRKLAVTRLEALGHDIGHRLVEKVAISKPLGRGALDDIKFICQHFWMEIFGKQVDKLQTDHRGTFVLKENSCSWLSHLGTIDTPRGRDEEEAAEIAIYLKFLCGIVRGALENIGFKSVVTADCRDNKMGKYVLPSVTFTVKVVVLYGKCAAALSSIL
eukprot:319721_1